MGGVECCALEFLGGLSDDVEDGGDGGGVEELDLEEPRLEHLVEEEGCVGVEEI